MTKQNTKQKPNLLKGNTSEASKALHLYILTSSFKGQRKESSRVNTSEADKVGVTMQPLVDTRPLVTHLLTVHHLSLRKINIISESLSFTSGLVFSDI